MSKSKETKLSDVVEYKGKNEIAVPIKGGLTVTDIKRVNTAFGKIGTATKNAFSQWVIVAVIFYRIKLAIPSKTLRGKYIAYQKKRGVWDFPAMNDQDMGALNWLGKIIVKPTEAETDALNGLTIHEWRKKYAPLSPKPRGVRDAFKKRHPDVYKRTTSSGNKGKGPSDTSNGGATQVDHIVAITKKTNDYMVKAITTLVEEALKRRNSMPLDDLRKIVKVINQVQLPLNAAEMERSGGQKPKNTVKARKAQRKVIRKKAV